MSDENIRLTDDKLRGVAAIAEFLGEKRRRTFYLCEKRLIPCGKLGGIWVASKSALVAHHRRTTGGEDY